MSWQTGIWIIFFIDDGGRYYEDEPESIKVKRLIRETHKGFQFEIGRELVWLPKSICSYDNETNTVLMPLWLKYEKGL